METTDSTSLTCMHLQTTLNGELSSLFLHNFLLLPMLCRLWRFQLYHGARSWQRLGKSYQRAHWSQRLTTWTTNMNMIDLWRNKHPTQRQYTWHNATHTIRCRLDKIYVQLDLIRDASASITACPFSDHSNVTVCINPPNSSTRGRGTWKLNISDCQIPTVAKKSKPFWPTGQPHIIFIVNLHYGGTSLKLESKPPVSVKPSMQVSNDANINTNWRHN